MIEKNPKNFRIFSPDELSSNKLDGVLDVTLRQFEGRIAQVAISQVRREGRVLEMLSEHTLQGWLQGYLLTGRHGVFPSYEAFLGIIGTMMDQYSKFIKVCKKIHTTNVEEEKDDVCAMGSNLILAHWIWRSPWRRRRPKRTK